MSDQALSEDLRQFKTHFDERFVKLYYSRDKKILICKLKADYVPIEHFKEAFHRISDFVKDGDYEKFIFDKRSLRAFHQPSMEWYYIEWKKEMYAHGLKIHRKILPNESWFEKSVMIAKQNILEDYPDNIIDKLDIKYCSSIKEAIEV